MWCISIDPFGNVILYPLHLSFLRSTKTFYRRAGVDYLPYSSALPTGIASLNYLCTPGTINNFTATEPSLLPAIIPRAAF